MSEALPGNHYCVAHQGNHSHYDAHNCDLCKALAMIDKLVAHYMPPVESGCGSRGVDDVLVEACVLLVEMKEKK